MMRPEDLHSNRRILLIEDDDATRVGYSELLQAHGFVVDAVATAAAARAAVDTHVPDVILADVTLPDGDGLALASTFREQARTARVPVIGITGHWTADARARARSAGVLAFLLKPSAPAHVIAEIHRVLADEEGEDKSDRDEFQFLPPGKN